MSLQSALLGYLLALGFKRPMTPQENVVLQTTAVATGTMPLAAGFVGIIPALTLLTQEQDGLDPIHVGWVAGVGWSCAVAFFGYGPSTSPSSITRKSGTNRNFFLVFSLHLHYENKL